MLTVVPQSLPASFAELQLWMNRTRPHVSLWETKSHAANRPSHPGTWHTGTIHSDDVAAGRLKNKLCSHPVGDKGLLSPAPPHHGNPPQEAHWADAQQDAVWLPIAPADLCEKTARSSWTARRVWGGRLAPWKVGRGGSWGALSAAAWWAKL